MADKKSITLSLFNHRGEDCIRIDFGFDFSITN